MKTPMTVRDNDIPAQSNQFRSWVTVTAVVSLLIVNSDGFSPSEYDRVFKAVGLDTLSYTPTADVTPHAAWPTLGSMIDTGKRLVTFMDHKADFATVSYIIDGGILLSWFIVRLAAHILALEFTNVWETAYDVTNTTFNCAVDRTKGDTSTQLYLINHFLDINIGGVLVPDKGKASSTNGVSGDGSLGLQVETCAAVYGRNPNFMLVDVRLLSWVIAMATPHRLSDVRRWPSLPSRRDC
jgi:hypothetical protein